MNPFAKRKVTEAERTEILAKARVEYYKAGSMQFLIAPTTEEYLESVDNGLEVIGTEFVVPAPLTAAERVDFDKRLNQNVIFDRVFANRRTDVSDLPPLLRKVADEEEARDLAELLGPGRRAQSALDEMISKAVDEALGKVGGNLESNRVTIPVRPLPERQAFLPLLENAEDEDSDAAKFVRAFVTGDEPGMRTIVREIVAAEAA